MKVANNKKNNIKRNVKINVEKCLLDPLKIYTISFIKPDYKVENNIRKLSRNDLYLNT